MVKNTLGEIFNQKYWKDFAAWIVLWVFLKNDFQPLYICSSRAVTPFTIGAMKRLYQY